MTVSSMYVQFSKLNKFPTFWSLIFRISTPQVKLFLVEKGNLKLSDSKKYDGERNKKHILTFVNL